MRCAAFLAAAILLWAPEAARGAEPEELPVDLSTRQTGSDWPGFLGPQRDGKSAETGLNFDWPEGGPPIVWQLPLGTSYSAPAISRGRLFHFDRYQAEDRYGDVDRLICREAETGRQLWTLDSPTSYEDLLGYNNGPRCSPVIDGPRVYTFNAEGVLQCVRIADGKRPWQVDTSEKFDVAKNFFGVDSTPLVFGDLVIVNVGGSPPGSPPDIYSARGEIKTAGSRRPRETAGLPTICVSPATDYNRLSYAESHGKPFPRRG